MEKKMPFSLNDYQDLSKRTLPEGKHSEVLTNMALGLVCEAGEVGDHIKKHVFHGHDLDDDKVKKELGDSLFYLAGVATLLGYTLEEIGTINIDKLAKRFPNGFNKEDSKKRVDTKIHKDDKPTEWAKVNPLFVEKMQERPRFEPVGVNPFSKVTIPLHEHEIILSKREIFCDGVGKQLLFEINNFKTGEYREFITPYADIVEVGNVPTEWVQTGPEVAGSAAGESIQKYKPLKVSEPTEVFCSTCEGRGKIRTINTLFFAAKTCPQCNGRGYKHV